MQRIQIYFNWLMRQEVNIYCFYFKALKRSRRQTVHTFVSVVFDTRPLFSVSFHLLHQTVTATTCTVKTLSSHQRENVVRRRCTNSNDKDEYDSFSVLLLLILLIQQAIL